MNRTTARRLGELQSIAWVLLLIFGTTNSATGQRTPETRSKSADIRAQQLPAFELPVSSFLNLQERLALDRWTTRVKTALEACPFSNDVFSRGHQARLAAYRKCLEEDLDAPLATRFRALYRVRVVSSTLAGVRVDIVTPSDGISPRNKGRVLINLHGGAFFAGRRYGGQIESIPIAAMGKIRVVSVDYRMAPEFEFPAASDDVVAVYRELLKSYRPEAIGIYGTSAGGLLTAQTVALLQKERLPEPGAVGMFCAAGSYFYEGDSGHFAAALAGAPAATFRDNPYLKNANPSDPLAFPAKSAEVMARFPPSLLISASRDQAFSSVVYFHSQLVALGVEADLHVWEGLGHAFFFDPDLPQSRQVYQVVAQFFDTHLAYDPHSRADSIRHTPDGNSSRWYAAPCSSTKPSGSRASILERHRFASFAVMFVEGREQLTIATRCRKLPDTGPWRRTTDRKQEF